MSTEVVHHSAVVGEVTLVLSLVLGLCAAGVLGLAFRAYRASGGPDRPRRFLPWLCAVDLCGAALFCALAHAVVLGATAHFDRRLELGIHRFDTPTVDTWMRAFTDLGSVWGMTVIVLIAVGVALSFRRRRTAIGIASVAVGSAALVEVLKNVFGRLRPQLFTEIPPLHSFSFPSGHSFSSAAILATLAVAVARARPGWSWLAFTLAALLTLAVGLSRIYLGVHWPTDVLAGFLLGSLLALNAAVWFAHEVPRGPSPIER